MPVNKHALIRYHALDKCFSNFAKRYYIEDLIQACNDALYDHTGNERYSDPLHPGISRRQVLVDIDFMESKAGWEALIERIKDGRRVYYRYEVPEYTINNQPITDEEMSKLRETMLMLSRFKGMPQFEWMESLLTNLEDKFHLQGFSDSVISMDGNEYAAGIEHLSPLFNAIVNKTPLLIEYKTFDGKEFKWEIHPYHIKQYNNRWFLIGLNNDEYHNISTVALDRIVNFEQLHRPFIENTIIEDFDDYFYDIVGVSFPPDAKVEKVVLKFSAHRFPYIQAKPIHGSQRTLSENDGTIQLNIIPNRELESIILSFGDDVEVLLPSSLRNAIATKIKKSCKKYETMQNDCTNYSYLCSVERETHPEDTKKQICKTDAV
ncbi:YafY family protein [Bacteroides caecimuris]|uniref:helix-turn-helix transcriptional regulator n=1 Tax=Bacteroides caecimuris TaxID=1796613 RepID=UPI00242FB657|nr:WYL domain-containing protein [Bacteroides caecimuris]